MAEGCRTPPGKTEAAGREPARHLWYDLGARLWARLDDDERAAWSGGEARRGRKYLSPTAYSSFTIRWQWAPSEPPLRSARRRCRSIGFAGTGAGPSRPRQCGDGVGVRATTLWISPPRPPSVTAW
jgi:hypothetical protein